MSIGARRLSRSKHGSSAPPSTLKASGVLAWFNPFSGPASTRIGEILAQDYVGGISAFCRWDSLSDNGTSWRYTGFDAVSTACASARKPWIGMIIIGGKGAGIPAYVESQIPANNWIDTDGATFPVFWSSIAINLHKEMMDRLVARYKDDPWCVGWRVTTFWSTHGEPWFAGGASGKPKWVSAWNATGHTGDLSAVQAAYQQHEKDTWAWHANAWPARFMHAQAGGDALYDVDSSVTDDTLPARHPDRLATWTDIRASLGSRVTYQFNGVAGGNGAEGYGKWLPNSFGPLGTVPASRKGRIGSQPVAEVDKVNAATGNIPLPADSFVTMIRNLTSWGYSYCEVYGVDVLKAIDANTASGIKIKNVLVEQKNNWQP